MGGLAEADKEFRVLVIGGDPAGVLTAHALKLNGVQATVFEQDASRDARTRDWNFGIYWARSARNEFLSDELAKEIIERGQVDNRVRSPDDFIPILNGHTGELLKSIPAPNAIRLDRKNFLRIVDENLGTSIQFGKKLQQIETDGKVATVHFEDGTSYSGSLVVGAEGAHSKVREFLLGVEESKLEECPIVEIVTLAKLPADAAKAFLTLHPRHVMAISPDGNFTWIGVHDAFSDTMPGDWNFLILHSWRAKDNYDPATLQGPAILAHLKERTKGLFQPLRYLIESVPEGTKCWHSRLSYWSPQQWDNRNSTVTLVGDAAHPMTHHRGQGLNHALQDVALLATKVRERGVTFSNSCESAISAYERDMLPRGKEAVTEGLENSILVHDWPNLMKSPLFRLGQDHSEDNWDLICHAR